MKKKKPLLGLMIDNRRLSLRAKERREKNFENENLFLVKRDIFPSTASLSHSVFFMNGKAAFYCPIIDWKKVT